MLTVLDSHACLRHTLGRDGGGVCLCVSCLFFYKRRWVSFTHTLHIQQGVKRGHLGGKKCVGSHLCAHVVLEKVRFTLTTLSNTFLVLTSERERELGTGDLEFTKQNIFLVLHYYCSFNKIIFNQSDFTVRIRLNLDCKMIKHLTSHSCYLESFCHKCRSWWPFAWF